MKARILEIFRSIQGEGPLIGVPQVFVRFFECNIHCTWCDSPNSIGDTVRHYKEMDVDQIFANVKKLYPGCHSVSLTGGEPLVQKEAIKALSRMLRKNKLGVYLETNGILPQPLSEVIDFVDHVAMDIKLPSSTKCQPFWDEHNDFLMIAKKRNVFVKVVITNDTQKAEVKRAIDLVQKIDSNMTFILQPNYFEMKDGSMKKCLEFEALASKKLKNVRIIPQVHKFMKLR